MILTRDMLGILWRTTYGLIGTCLVFARDAVADTVGRRVLADAQSVTRDAMTYISAASAIGGFIMICLSIRSISLKIRQQQRDWAEHRPAKPDEDAQ